MGVLLDIEVIDGIVLKHFRVTTPDGEYCDKSILKVTADNFRLNSKISENITWNVEFDSKEELEQELSNISELFIKNGIVTFSGINSIGHTIWENDILSRKIPMTLRSV